MTRFLVASIIIEVNTLLDYRKITDDLRQHYAAKAASATPGSMERHAYTQIAQWIEQSNAANYTGLPENQIAVNAQVSLMTLAKTIDPRQARPLVVEAINELADKAQIFGY